MLEGLQLMAGRGYYYRPGPPKMRKRRDFDIFDELVSKEDTHITPNDVYRGCIVFDIDSTLYGTTDGAVRVMNEAGTIFCANKNTHRVLRKHS